VCQSIAQKCSRQGKYLRLVLQPAKGDEKINGHNHVDTPCVLFFDSHMLHSKLLAENKRSKPTIVYIDKDNTNDFVSKSKQIKLFCRAQKTPKKLNYPKNWIIAFFDKITL
jgi:hypothetical protein